jgi:hypothetical protein
MLLEKLKVRRRPRVAEAALHLADTDRLSRIVRPFAHQRVRPPRYNLQPRISAFLLRLLEARDRTETT